MTTPTKKKPGPKPKTIEYFRSKNTELRRSLTAKDSEIITLKAAIGSAEGHWKGKAVERQNLIDMRNLEIEKKNQSIKTLTDTLRTKLEEVDTLMAEVTSLRDEKANLVRGATRDRDTLEALRTRVGEMTSHCDVLKSDLKSERGKTSIMLEAVRALGEGLK